MKPKVIFLSVVVTWVGLAPSSVAETGDPWLGTWKMNIAKSLFNPGPAPTGPGGTVTFEAWGDGIQRTNPDPKGVTYAAKYDGKDYPVKNNPNADTISFRRVNAYTYELTTKLKGEVKGVNRGMVTSDGKTRVVITIGKNAKGDDFANLEWFERQ